MRWNLEASLELANLWRQDVTGERIAAELSRFGSCNRGEVYRHARHLGLPQRQRGPKRRPGTKPRVPYFSKFHRIPPAKPGYGLVLKPDHRAIVEGRTLFRKTIRFVEETNRVLKSGHNQRKVGDRVTKGKWKGFPIYCLTLEERATCPSHCAHWLDCYGNNMHRAERIVADADFEEVLWLELEALHRKHRGGFVVRLHILGDFYSVGYVKLWQRALRAFPSLHVFGYTARRRDDPIGRAVLSLASRRWDHFAIRRSGFSGPRGATTFNAGETPQGIACPAQTGQTDCCGTCGLCWSTDKTIAFESHGRRTDVPWRSQL